MAHVNPYIAGQALDQRSSFVGRQDIFELLETEFGSSARNAVVIYGQRRIGKTSILLQLRHRLDLESFCPIFFDVMQYTTLSLGQMLFALARTAARTAGYGLASEQSVLFDDQGIFFRQEFLPGLYAALGDVCRPIITLDEFDKLEEISGTESAPAASAFISYLQVLMQEERRLAFVFVVGKNIDDLTLDLKETFKSARSQRISVLDSDSARKLIKRAEDAGSLHFSDQAVERILGLTTGHPYLTQYLCQILWDAVDPRSSPTVPQIGPAQVDSAIPQLLQASHSALIWVWEGLSHAERVILAALAEVTTPERVAASKDRLLELLRQHGVRILVRELDRAPDVLVDRELIVRRAGTYSFFVEAMRLWVVERKPLAKVKDELDKISPVADTLYQGAQILYQNKELIGAQRQLNEALRVNANHLKARLLLGQIFHEEGQFIAAIRELEQACNFDRDAARFPLIQTLLAHADVLERQAETDPALEVYRRVLELSPGDIVAQEHRDAIWVRRGDTALAAKNLELARSCYAEARAAERIAEVDRLMLHAEVERLEATARAHDLAEEWEQAVTTYQRLLEIDGERWRPALQHAQCAQVLEQAYTEAIGALQQESWTHAQRLLATIIAQDAGYKDSAELLARAVRMQRMLFFEKGTAPTMLISPAAVSIAPGRSAWLGAAVVLIGAGLGLWWKMKPTGSQRPETASVSPVALAPAPTPGSPPTVTPPKPAEQEHKPPRVESKAGAKKTKPAAATAAPEQAKSSAPPPPVSTAKDPELLRQAEAEAFAGQSDEPIKTAREVLSRSPEENNRFLAYKVLLESTCNAHEHAKNGASPDEIKHIVEDYMAKGKYTWTVQLIFKLGECPSVGEWKNTMLGRAYCNLGNVEAINKIRNGFMASESQTIVTECEKNDIIYNSKLDLFHRR